MDDIREILKEFVGLIALIEIDNWAGMLFELYLDTFHNGLTQMPDYLVFETDFNQQVACYYHTIGFIFLGFIMFVSHAIDTRGMTCNMLELFLQPQNDEQGILDLYEQQPYFYFNSKFYLVVWILMIIISICPYVSILTILYVRRKFNLQ